jgi:hypothetical protein
LPRRVFLFSFDQRGVAFSAEEVVLDKQPVPREDIAPVSEAVAGNWLALRPAVRKTMS